MFFFPPDLWSISVPHRIVQQIGRIRKRIYRELKSYFYWMWLNSKVTWVLQNYTCSVEFSNLPSPFCSCIGCATALTTIIRKVGHCRCCFCLGMLIFHIFLRVTFLCCQFEVTMQVFIQLFHLKLHLILSYRVLGLVRSMQYIYKMYQQCFNKV